MANTHGTVSDLLVKYAWRQGRRNQRLIYAQIGEYSHDDDPMIGVLDTPMLAHAVVEAHNAGLERGALAAGPADE